MKKVLSLVVLVCIIWLGYSQKDVILELIRSGGTLSVLVSILFVAVLVFFPVMPFLAVAGIIGAVFGTWMGTSISLAGAVLGACLMFGLARFGFRDWADRLLEKYPKTKEYERYFEKNAFVAIMLFRIIPIIPSPAINVISGVTRVRWFTFFLATVIGKIPSILIFTFAGSTFENNKTASFITYGIYFVAIFLAVFYFQWKKQKEGSKKE